MNNNLQVLSVGLSEKYKKVVTAWVSTGDLGVVAEKLSELKCRKVTRGYANRFLRVGEVEDEVQRQLLAYGYDRVEMERDLVKDIKGVKELKEGQRESIKVLAKVRGYMGEGVQVNAEYVNGINILQSNGKA